MAAVALRKRSYLTLPEIAEELQVDISTICRWIGSGISVRGRLVRLKALRVGCRWRVTTADLNGFIAELNK